MGTRFSISGDQKTPKYLQVINSINNAILNGKLRKGDQIFSINELSHEFLLGRDTVQKAYNILREKGVLKSIPGKGFFINRTDVTTPFRILLLFNKISNYKKLIYNSFVQTMGEKAQVDLKIHYFNTDVLENLLIEHLLDYDYFVIMPHFYDHLQKLEELLDKIPPNKLILLDKDIKYHKGRYAAVFQDFRNDIYDALETGLSLLKKYSRLILVVPTIVPYPPEITTGFRNFCFDQGFAFRTIPEIALNTQVQSGDAYVVIEETDLVNLVKCCHSARLSIGKEVGIISYNDTPLKEILLEGITVISTDHTKMGETAARLILEDRQEKIRNPFTMIRRSSL